MADPRAVSEFKLALAEMFPRSRIERERRVDLAITDDGRPNVSRAAGVLAPEATPVITADAVELDNNDSTDLQTYIDSLVTSGAPTDATYIVQTSHSGLSAEQALSALSTGILKVTTTTGVLSTAVAADLPAGIDAAKISGGTVSNTEFDRLDGVTGAIQGQIDGKAALIHTHVPGDVTGFDTQVRTSRLDQMAAPTASVSLNSQKITNLLDPTNAQDAASKAYVDAIASGYDLKASVRVASTGNITIATPGASIDGVTLSSGNRVLLKDQSTGSQNGIYIWNGAAVAMTRATDADTSAEVTSGMFVFVEEGTANADQGYALTTNNPITLGTTALVFTQISGAGQITAGTGLQKTGNQLSIDSTVVTLTGAQALTNKTLTSPAITTPTGIVKGDVGLGNVDNTSDATKNAAAVTLTNKTLTAPTIADFTNAAHDHGDADDGGTLVAAAYPTMVGDSGAGGTKGAVPAPGAGDAAAGKFLKADATWALPPGGGGSGDVVGPASSVDSEVALFSLTTGKLLKRASATGIAKLASGVLSAVAAPSGAIVGDTDVQTLANKTVTDLVIDAGSQLHSGSGSPEDSVTAPEGSLYLRTDASSVAPFYVKADSAGNDGWIAVDGHARSRWESGAHHDPGATTLSTKGSVAWTAGTGTSADTSVGSWLNYATTNVSGNANGPNGPLAYRSDWGIDCTFHVNVIDVTSIRLWIGLFVSDPSGTATPPQEMAGFRFDTGAGDTAWQCRVRDATTAQTTTSGVAVSTGNYLLRMLITTSAIRFYIDDVFVVQHTANLPGGSTLLAPWVRVTTLAAAIKNVRFGFFNALSR